MIAHTVERDERTTLVENAGYRLAYLFLAFGLLVAVAFRGFAHGEASWDLFGLVVLSGAVHAGYQRWHRVVHKHWLVVTASAMVGGAILAFVIALLRRRWGG